jgi:proteasome activator subunit 4
MLARFIVYTIFSSSNSLSQDETTLTYLSNMIQATESFYHPSNFGRWTFSIVRFLQYLGGEFLKRWTDGMLIYFLNYNLIDYLVY